jgi:hypothetical protein
VLGNQSLEGRRHPRLSVPENIHFLTHVHTCHKDFLGDNSAPESMIDPGIVATNTIKVTQRKINHIQGTRINSAWLQNLEEG